MSGPPPIGSAAATGRELDIVVLNWKTAEMSAECARAARAAMPEAAIYVVDNGSGDGSPETLRQALPWATVIETGSNLGFGGGMNAGIRAGRRPFVMIVNSDARPVGPAFGALLAAAASDPRTGAVTPSVLDEAARPVLQMEPEPAAWKLVIGFIPVVWRLVQSKGFLPTGDGPRPLAWLPTLCVTLFRRQAIEEIGCFDPGYFLGWEEWDITRRLTAGGWRIAVDPGAQVVHAGWGSTPKNLARWRNKHGRASVCHHLRKYHGPIWYLLGWATRSLTELRVALSADSLRSLRDRVLGERPRGWPKWPHGL